MRRNSFDPASLEILWSRLVSIVDVAATAFERTAFSAVVRESNDYSVVLTDARARLLAQSTRSIPSFLCTLPNTVRHFLECVPTQEIRVGDIMITNDPWKGTGHLSDISIAMPLFHCGRLCAFAAATSHMPDIGGRLRDPQSLELFEEGLQIPMLKLVEQGEINQTLVSVIERNVRVPKQTMGDIWGEVAACRTLEGRLQHLLAEMPVELDPLAVEIQNRAEAAMRERIRRIPDGDYEFASENDVFDVPLVVRCRVAVRGDRIHVDFTGSSEQQRKAVNVVPIYAYAYTAFALKSMLAPDVPNNDGSFRPLTTWAPPGSILNPRYPAACVARSVVGHLIAPSVMGALASALPERGQAAPGSPNNSISLAGSHRGRPFAVLYFFNGGQGASHENDGSPTLSFPSNTANTPIEVMEANAPIEVSRRALRRDSGGRGAWRGGDGQTLELIYRGDSEALASIRVNRSCSPALGLFGGEPGKTGRLRVNGRTISSVQSFVVKPGDTITMDTAGAGGYGTPR